MTATIEIRRNKLGWGGVVKFTTRSYAAFVNGEPMVSASGAIRTFETRQAARKAAEAFVSKGGRA
jgi:hypothetical protein